jgi:DNA-binding MarR family transcriptional regulator
MARAGDRKARAPTAADGNGGQDVTRLLRNSHIFASAVREVLEAKMIREASPQPLTLAQLHILKLMTTNDQHRVTELADLLGVSPPAATKNIDKLERLGLVARAPSPDDRRATLLSVSARGRRLVDRYEHIKRERLLPVLGEFRPEELDQLASLLERFSVSLLQRERSHRGYCLRCDAYIEADCPVGRVRGGCPYQLTHAPKAAPYAAAPRSPS